MSHKRSHDTASDDSPASSPAKFGPDAADTTVQSQAKRPRSQRYPGRFPGAFNYDALRTGPKPFGNHLWHLPPVADGDVEISIFAGAEVRRLRDDLVQPNHRITDLDGGVAVVCSHVRETQQAWHVFPAIGLDFCEALAIIEAIQLANLELRTATNHEGIGATSSRPIKVKIHSASEKFFERIEKETFATPDTPIPHLQQPGTALPGSSDALSMHPAQAHFMHSAQELPMHPLREELDIEGEKERLMKDLVERAIKAAEQLQKLPGGLEVELEMHCVEANDLPVEHNRMQFEADELAHYRAKTRGGDTFTVDDDDFKPQPGFWASLKSPLLVSPADRLALALAPPKPPSTVMGGWALIDRDRDLGNSRQLQDLVERERDLDRREAAILDEDYTSHYIKLNYDRAMEERRVSKEEREAAFMDRQAAANDRQAAAEDRQVAADYSQAAAEYRQATAEEREAAAEARQAADEDRQAAAEDRKDAAEARQAAAYDRKVAAEDREKAAEARQVAVLDRIMAFDENIMAVKDRNMAMKEHSMAIEEHSTAVAERRLAVEEKNAVANERISLIRATAQVEARAQALAEREQAFEAHVTKEQNDRIRRQEEEEAQSQGNRNERALWDNVVQLREQALAVSEAALKEKQQGAEAQIVRDNDALAAREDALRERQQSAAAQIAREKDALAAREDALREKEQAAAVQIARVAEREQAFEAQAAKKENDRIRRQEEEEAAQIQENRNERAIWTEVFQLRQRALASSEEALRAKQQGADTHIALEEKARAIWREVLQTTEQALAVREASLRAKELRAAQSALEKDELSNWNDMLQDKERTILARGQALSKKEEALAARDSSAQLHIDMHNAEMKSWESRLEAWEAQLSGHQG